MTTGTLTYVFVCKQGGVTNALYDFEVVVDGGTPTTYSVRAPGTNAFNVDANCAPVYLPGSAATASVQITELLGPGAPLPSIEVTPGATYTIDGARVTLTPDAGMEVHAQYTNPMNVCTDPAASNYLGALPCTYPPPEVCTDQNASNYGGPLPCVYDTTPCPAGSFTFSYNANGDLSIVYDQFPAPNDNSYGVNAVGWQNGHKFTDLVGSDHAGFQLVDPGGVVRLSFNVDYLSASTTAPSGYASLGVTGGDGKMLIGTADGITATTSLARNLNNVNIPGLFVGGVQQFGSVNLKIDSPPTDPAHTTYVISDPLLVGWDFHDTYFVTISAAKLASIGFNPATWQVLPNASQLHNSPAKACPPSTTAALSITKYEVKDKQVKITIANTGGADVILNALTLDWPSLVNGKLMQVKLDGDVVYSGPAIASGPVSLTAADLVTDTNKRKLNHGSSDVYTLVFEKNADTNLAHYTGTVTFGSTTLTVLPH